MTKQEETRATRRKHPMAGHSMHKLAQTQRLELPPCLSTKQALDILEAGSHSLK